jgi:uncharacterized protein (TIGR02594 family)
VNVTLYSLAQRYIGIEEIPGEKDHPLIRWWHSLCGGEAPDEVPWCSAFVNGVAWELDLPRSQSKAARSWLAVGTPVALADAQAGYDVVIFSRGPDPQPGPEVLDAPGHVGLYTGRYWLDGGIPAIQVLGGNQGSVGTISVATFKAEHVLGVRRLHPSEEPPT